MNDLPTIEEGYVSPFREYPANDPIQYAFPRTGNFIIERDPSTKVLLPETLVLYDDYARVQHAPANVSLTFPVSSPREGKKKFPRPFIYERVTQNNIETLKLVSVGEKLKITYINGNIKQPLVENAIESLAIINQENFLRIDENNLDRQAEKYETDDYLYAFENDGKGEFKLFVTTFPKNSEKNNTGGTGNLTVDLIGTDGNGNATFGFNGTLTLNQKDVDGKIIQQLILDFTNKKIAFNQYENEELKQTIEMTLTEGIKLLGYAGEAKEYMTYGETLKEKLEAILDGIGQMKFANGGGLTGPPLNAITFTTIKSELEEILVK